MRKTLIIILLAILLLVTGCSLDNKSNTSTITNESVDTPTTNSSNTEVLATETKACQSNITTSQKQCRCYY